MIARSQTQLQRFFQAEMLAVFTVVRRTGLLSLEISSEKSSQAR
jgi:hypothetical protein